MSNRPFSSVLVANRGEIARRILRTCRAFGLRTVAVYTDADATVTHHSAADHAVRLEGARGYLDTTQILRAAKETGAEAIHPGYGFLAENADFATQVEAAGLVFIGPTPEALRLAGEKDAARELARKLGIPLPPGSGEATTDLDKLIDAAKTVGYPLLVKAAGGGGGRGMRLIRVESELKANLESALREAQNAFGRGDLILEHYVEHARHIEIQLLGDTHGNVVHLFERDCSLQRRYQKVIEEAPALGLSDSIREQLFDAAVRFAKALPLTNAATAEFLVPHSASGPAPFYFLEVNPRIQVEHPVTELITGLDLVALQIRSAQGLPLPFAQPDIHSCGHAIEARVCAEDPEHHFAPRVGTVQGLAFPVEQAADSTVSFLRFDHALQVGTALDTTYDSLIVKVIASAPTADVAHNWLRTTLPQVFIGGVQTNIPWLSAILRDSECMNPATRSTRSLDDTMPQLIEASREDPALPARIAAWVVAELQRWKTSTSHQPLSYHLPLRFALRREGAVVPQRVLVERKRIAALPDGCTELTIIIDGTTHQLHVSPVEQGTIYLVKTQSGATNTVRLLNTSRDEFGHLRGLVWADGVHTTIERCPPIDQQENATSTASSRIVSPLPGTVHLLPVEAGAPVRKGDTVAVIESMKMEHTILAPCDGTIQSVHAQKGDRLQQGQLLLEIAADNATEAIS